MADQYAYPFDPTGQAASNRIVDEQIIVNSPGDRLFHFTLPKFAPFFEEGAELKLRTLDGSIIPLTNKVDYYFSHKFMEATLATMHPVWGSITFLRRDIVGTLLFTYQTLGGEWTVDYQKILEIMVNTSVNPRITTWEQVTDRPREFPVIDHPWNLVDMVGWSDVVDVLERFLNAYIASLDPNTGGGSSAIIYAHINNFLNPHRTTADQVGAFSKEEINAILADYRKKTDPVTDSERLNGKTYGQVMADAAAQTVANSQRLNNYTYAQLAVEILKGTAANALKLEGRNTQELAELILAGKAANSDKLDGFTRQEILAQVQGAGGDAQTLQGKSLLDIMNDVVATKVNLAANAEKLEGRTTAQLITYLTSAMKPDNATNADQIANMDVNALTDYMQANLDFQKGQAITGEFIDGPIGFTAGADIYIPFIQQELDAPLYGSLFQVLVHKPEGVTQSWVKIGFDNTTKKPIIQVTAGDLAEADISFGYTDMGTGSAREIFGWLRLKNNFTGVTMNCFNQFSPMTWYETADWQDTAPAGVTWGTYTLNPDLQQTQAAFDDIGAHIQTLIEDPAVPTTP